VADAAGDGAVRIAARELGGIGARVGVRRAIGIALHRDGRHGDDREGRQSPFQVVKLRIALDQSEPPAVVVDHDGHVIRIVERGSAALEGGVVEGPFR